MIPYIIMFVLSISLISIGLRLKKSPVGKVLEFIGLLLPCVMACLRSINVGTDTKGYIHNLYNLSSGATNFSHFLKISYSWYLQNDVLYLFITYITEKWDLGFRFLLFIYECLVIFPIYISLRKVCKTRYAIIIGLISFYLLLYNVSFNMLRQCISIGFTTLAFAYYLDGDRNKHKLLPYFLVLIAYGFHSTAIIVLLVFLLYKLYASKKISSKFKFLFTYVMVVSMIIFAFGYNDILLVIGKSGIYKLALYYISNYSTNDISFYQIFINLLIVLMVIINKKNIRKLNISYTFLLILSVLNLVVSTILSYHIQYSQRIMLYLQYILIFLFIPRFATKNKSSRYIYVFYIAILCVTWYLYFVYMNVNETVPYVMSM